MCGVAFVWRTKVSQKHERKQIEEKLTPRGPDKYGFVQRDTKFGSFELHASVLHVRGDQITPQPIENAFSDILCWNGEIFGGTDMPSDMALNDTQWLSDAFERASIQSDPELAILDVITSIRGPFAVLFYHQRTHKVYFGHDRFGRRSLVYHTQIPHLYPANATTTSAACSFDHIENTIYQNESLPSQYDLYEVLFSLSSVTLDLTCQQGYPIDNQFDEVPCTGMFCLNLKSSQLTHFPFPNLSLDRLKFDVSDLTYLRKIQDQYNCFASDSTFNTTIHQRSALSLLFALSNAVGIRVRTIPSPISAKVRIAILFSGGLDSVVLAALTHYHVPDYEPIELLNVCFDSIGFQSPDRLAARVAAHELKNLFPAREWRLIEINTLYEEVLHHQHSIHSLMKPCDTHMDFNIGAAFYFLARGTGQWNTSISIEPALEAQLLESPQIETKRSVCLFPNHKNDSLKCPVTNCGRKWKRECLLMVCRVCCFRIQNIVRLCSPIDVKYDVRHMKTLEEMGICSIKFQVLLETLTSSERDSFHCHKHPTLTCTISRPSTERKAVQKIHQEPLKASYSSSARVVLVGIGADEQLAGYGRHKTAFLNGGHGALAQELAMDMGRIWKRNLGRDDRCISAHGKEARFPYLDENVVCLLGQMPTEVLTDFSRTTDRGRGDKYLLRLVARDFLGLKHCAGLSKRAIQFGSRIAKCSNATAFQSNRKASGTALFHLQETGSTT
ncbi:unnamed protein product [Albugo candida]|uniref:Asparagine synthetase domain-containing protein n=1 Tax=Albugo candida TaxID=65357 RepID=A0A024GS68_9STRA|nr:unnamed protein product [Albugo candida]|eukprot:CCI49558.1 unnamed protein product [Albugo candida]